VHYFKGNQYSKQYSQEQLSGQCFKNDKHPHCLMNRKDIPIPERGEREKAEVY